MATTKNLTEGNDNFSPDNTYEIINGLGGDDTIDLRFSSINFQPTAWNFAFTVNGGDGNDTLTAGPGISGGTDTATLNGDAGNDTLTGGENSDTLNGGADNDILEGHTSRTNLTTVGPSDFLNGGAGNDTMILNYEGFYFDKNGIQPPEADLTKPMAVTVDLSADGTVLIHGDGTSSTYFGEAFTSIEILQFDGPEGNDIVTGGAFNDSISGNGGDDVIKAMGGDDFISDQYDHIDIDGGSGNDFLSLSPDNVTGDVVIDASTGSGNLTVGGADYGTFANIEHLNFIGGTGNDTITGLTDNYSSQRTLLQGNDGDDIIVAGVSASTSGSITEIDGGAGDDMLTGGAGNDILVGGAGKDTIHAGGGDDSIDVDISSDLVAGEVYDGGGGNDTLFVSSQSNSPVIHTADFSAVTISGIENFFFVGPFETTYDLSMSTAQFLSFASVVDQSFSTVTIHLTDTSLLTITGVEKFSILQLADGGVTVDATGAGAGSLFTIHGGSGDDHIATNFGVFGGDGNDVITGASTSLLGEAGDDSLTTTTTFAATLQGGIGNDTLKGGSGNDTLIGGAGDDTLDGGGGTNTLSYQDSTTAVTVNLSTHTVGGADAAGDTITFSSFANLTGGAGSDVLTGDNNANTIASGGGNDTLIGLGGNDTITGGNGNDILDGGAGNDKLNGVGGTDTFVYDGQGADSIIGGFTAGHNGDIIKIMSLYDSFAQIQSHMSVVGNNTVISFTSGNSLTINNVKTGITAENFEFSVDATKPTITGISSTPGSGAFNQGQTIKIDLTTSEAVTVAGTPTLKLSDGGVAIYNSGGDSNATTLEFDYTVAAGQNTAAGATLKTSSLAGGTIKDLAGNGIVVTGAANKDLGVTIDTKAPVLTDKLVSDTGTVATDKITSDSSLSGTGEASAVVTFTEGATTLGTVTAGSKGAWTYTPVGLADGVHTIVASETDAAGNTGSASLTFTLDTTGPAPSAMDVSSSPGGGGRVGAGSTAIVTINLGESVKVTGTPTLVLSNGAVATYAATSSHLTTGQVAFSYKVVPGHDTSDLTVDHVVIPSGGSITDTAGNPAVLTGVAGADLGLTVDTVAPTTTIAGTPNSGALDAGQPLEIDLNTSEAVTVTGAPTLKLSDGGIATYSAGDSSASMLVFHYVTLAGQNTPDLKVTSLTLPVGSSIKDAAGNPLSTVGIAGTDLHVSVDTILPTVKSIVATPSHTGPLVTGDTVTFTLHTSEHVNVDAGVTLTLSNGEQASLISGAVADSDTVVFHYIVGPESTADLKVFGIDQSGGDFTDLAGNALTAAVTLDTKTAVNLYTWKGGAGDFDDPTHVHWTQGSVPPDGATVQFGAGKYAVTAQGTDHHLTAFTVGSGVTLELEDHTFAASGMNDAKSSNAGTIQIDDGARLELEFQTFANSGAINIKGSSTDTILDIGGGTVTLNGGGKIILADSDHSIIKDFAPGTLVNVDNTISGAGHIGNNTALTLINQAKGTIDATGTHTLVIDSLDPATNAGVMEATGGGRLEIDTSVTNSNLIQAFGGNAAVVVTGAGVEISNVGATARILASGAGAHVDFDNGASVTGGQLATKGGGVINANGAIFSGGVTNTGTVNVDSLQFLGNIKNTATGVYNITDSFELLISATLSGGGKITLSDTNAVLGTDGSQHTLTNVDNLISGFGTVGDEFLTLVNQTKGIINANSAGHTLTIEMDSAHHLSNAGLIEASAGGTLKILSTDIDNTGTVSSAATSHVVLDDATITGGNVTVAKGGFLETLGDTASTISGAKVSNAGTIDANHGDLTITGAVTNAATGVLVADDSHLTVTGAVTGGNATVANGGTLEFGAASSILNVEFADSATAGLIIDHSMMFKGTISGFAATPTGTVFSNFFAFGDSTIDSGWFPTAIANGDTNNEPSAGKTFLITSAVSHGGVGDPVGFGLMGSQILANDFGYTAVPADAAGGGNNYAISGAVSAANAGGTVANTPAGGNAADPGNGSIGNLNTAHPLPSTVQQIANYLTANGNVADSTALYLIGTGGNDITFAKDTTTGLGNDTTAQKQAYLIHQADQLAGEIATLQHDGAQTILVHGLAGDNGDPTTNFNALFDSELFSQLDTLGVTYVRSDLSTMKSAIVANPTAFGFTASTVAPGTASSTTTSSAFIDLDSKNILTGWGQWGAPTGIFSTSYAYLRSPSAEYTSLYSDDQHFSTQGQQIEADYDLSVLFATGAAAMDHIDLKDIAYAFGTTTATYSGTKSGGTLTVTDAAHNTTNLILTGDYTAANFVTATDGHGGTAVIEAAPSASAQADVTSSHLLDTHYAGAVTAGMNYAVLDFMLKTNVTLKGDTGGVLLSSADFIETNGVAHTLTNSEIIHGGGFIGDAFLTLTNSATGTIDADNTTNGMVIHTSGHAASNAGTIEATGGGWLLVSHSTITDAATAHFTADGANSLIDLDTATINGGIVTVGAGATVDAVNGDASTVNAAIANSGTLSAFGGSHLTITGAVTGSGAAHVGSGGVLEFGSGSSANVTFVTLSGTSAGALMLDKATNTASQFTGTIANFVHGDDIDLGAINFAGAQVSNAVADAGNTHVTVTDGTHTETLTFVGSYLVTDFTINQDANHHVDLLHV